MQAYDKVSAGYNTLDSDSSNDLSAVFSDKGNGTLEVTIKRALDTGDNKDYVLQTDRDFDMGWAVNTSSSNVSQKHNQRGSFKAKIQLDSNDSN